MLEILKNVKLVVLDTDIWTGRSSLQESDLKMTVGKELPPAKLAKLGNKYIYDPERLAPFHKLKAAATRTILKVGTRFLGAYAVPNEKIEGLTAELNSIEAEFNTEIAKEFEPENYKTALDSWVSKNTGWEDIISRSSISPEDAAEKLKFAVRIIEISPVKGQEESLKKAVDGLAGQLRQEIEVMAQSTWKQSFQGKTVVTQRAIRPIRTMVEKIDGLTFLEPSLCDLVKGLQDTLASLPAKGILKGKNMAAACGILSVLGNIPEAAEAAEAAEAEEAEETTETADGAGVEESDVTMPSSSTIPPVSFIPPVCQAAAQPAEWF